MGVFLCGVTDFFGLAARVSSSVEGDPFKARSDQATAWVCGSNECCSYVCDGTTGEDAEVGEEAREETTASIAQAHHCCGGCEEA